MDVARAGEPKEAWVVDYVDQHGDRHIKTFAKKRDADAHHAIVGDRRPRRHPHRRQQERHRRQGRRAMAGLLRCRRAWSARRSPPTAQHVDLHIVPVLGALKLSQLTVPLVRGFEDRLRRTGARRRWCARPAARSARSSPTRRSAASWRRTSCARCAPPPRQGPARRAAANGKLKIGVDIPSPDEIARHRRPPRTDRWRPLLLTAIFTGLRASELRGLRWDDVDLKRGELHVRQRADRYGKIGRPKSEAGERTVPLPPMVVTALREHRLACPPNDRDLVFPNSRGSIEHRNTIVERGFHPAQVAAGVVDRRRRGQVSRPAQPAPLLCVLVHQPARRRRARAAAQGGAGAARSRLDPDDGGHLRPPVPARRRRSGACPSRARVIRLSTAL